MTLSIADVFVCWTPDRDGYPAGFRGKARIFPAGTAEADLAPFAYRAGHCDSVAHDPRLEVRQAHCLRASVCMTQRDGLDVDVVHRLWTGITEYRSALADDLAEASIGANPT